MHDPSGLDIALLAFVFLIICGCIGAGCALLGVYLGRVFLNAIGGLNYDDIVFDHPFDDRLRSRQ